MTASYIPALFLKILFPKSQIADYFENFPFENYYVYTYTALAGIRPNPLFVQCLLSYIYISVCLHVCMCSYVYVHVHMHLCTHIEKTRLVQPCLDYIVIYNIVAIMM